MSTTAKIELFEGRDGKWYFHRKAGNGKISAPSQGYTHRRSARSAAKRDLPGLDIVVIVKEY